jgi:hypothetical protein
MSFIVTIVIFEYCTVVSKMNLPTLSTKLPIIWNCFAYEWHVQWVLQLIQLDIRCGGA